MEQWLWYVAFPIALVAGTSFFGLVVAKDSSSFLTYVVPVAIGTAVSFVPAGWWLTHFKKAVSERATNLSVLGLLASFFIEMTRYTLAIDSGITYSIFEACALVGFVPGFLCSIYYVGMDGDEIRKDQNVIIDGFLLLIYVGIGSYSVRNIASGVFHVNPLTPQVWLWLARAGIQAAVVLMIIGILMTRRDWKVTMTEHEEHRKETWGETLRTFTFVLTTFGVLLSGFSLTPQGGLIAIIVGLLLYPIGLIVTKLSKSEPASTSLSLLL